MASADLERLSGLLLDPGEAQGFDAHGSKDAAVLVPIFDWPENPGLVLTERRHDMRRHAGEISFPGGRADPGEGPVECALREAHEEIGLDPAAVQVVGALPPTSTVVTSYKVLPVVGLIPAGLAHSLSPNEVERVIELRLDELRDGFAMRRLDPPRRPLPDAHLRRRRQLRLGSDRAHAADAVRAHRRLSAGTRPALAPRFHLS